MRTKIDLMLRAYGAFIIRFKWAVLAFFILLTGFMVSRLPHLTVDTSNESFFAEDAPILLGYNEFREQFGRDDMVMLLLEPKEVFDREFLLTLKKMHQELETLDPLVKEVNSLYNARRTMGVGDELVVEDLLEKFPETEEEIGKLKEYVLAHPLYKNLLISEDGRFTAITLETSAFSMEGVKSATKEGFGDLSAEGGFGGDFGGLNDLGMDAATPQVERKPITDQENNRIVFAIDEFKKKYESENLKIRLAGTPVITAFLKQAMQKDMMRLTLMAIGGIVFFLFLLYRRFTGVFLPLLTVILSLQYTLALMSLTGTAIKLPTQILPSFLLAVGISASVHMMALFYKDYVKDQGNKEAAILDSLEHSGLPIAMTSLTTAASLLSFSTAEVAPIGDLGIFAATGVIIALFMTLTLIPCLLAILPSRSVKTEDPNAKETFIDRTLVHMGDLAHDHAGKVALFAAFIFVVAVAGLPQLKFKHLILEWFPKESAIYTSTMTMDEVMHGSVAVEMVVDTGEENGLYEPKIQEGLLHMEEFIVKQKTSEGLDGFGKAISLATMLREINQALGGNDPAHYVIPQNRETIAQEFLLFENSGSDDLERNVDSLFSKARLTAKGYALDSASYVGVIRGMEEEAKKTFGDKVKITVTGMLALFSETITLMLNTMVTSYFAAAGVITILMILLIGKVRLGLLSMIPNLLPIVMTLGLMGWLGVNLDMFTLLIGSIAIGLAVDDTIHFFHNYRKYYEKYQDSKLAIEHTLNTAGRAMLVTSIVLTLGFWVFMLGTLNNVFNFGLLTGFALLLAFFSDVLLAPALMTLVERRRIRINS